MRSQNGSDGRVLDDGGPMLLREREDAEDATDPGC
jgi:hypothetical protein